MLEDKSISRLHFQRTGIIRPEWADAGRNGHIRPVLSGFCRGRKQRYPSREMRPMRTVVALLACTVVVRGAAGVDAGPWEFHSSVWMSLHQTLIADAMRTAPRTLPELSAEERAVWNNSVNAYRTAGGRGDMTFARPMLLTTDGLTQVADEAVDPLLDVPLKDALMAAAPVYRRHWWAADDQANRFFINYASAMMRDTGDALVRAHEAVYRANWPDRVRAYIAPSGGPFGAYTVLGRSGGVITTMSSRDAGYSGLRVVEMLLHESSHAIVNPNNGAVAAAIAAAAKKHGVEVPRD